jgi:hypothetical protein
MKKQVTFASLLSRVLSRFTHPNSTLIFYKGVLTKVEVHERLIGTPGSNRLYKSGTF